MIRIWVDLYGGGIGELYDINEDYGGLQARNRHAMHIINSARWCEKSFSSACVDLFER